MSGFTGLGKNEALEAIKAVAKYVGGFSQSSEVSLTGQVSTEELKLASGHGLSVGDLIMFTTLTGGKTGANPLFVGRPYFVIVSNAEGIKISQKESGTAEVWAETVTAGKYVKLTELSGGSPTYARVGTSFGTASKGKLEDVTGHALNVKAGATISHIGYFQNSSGTPTVGVFTLAAPEAFSEQGTYTVASATFDDSLTIA